MDVGPRGKRAWNVGDFEMKKMLFAAVAATALTAALRAAADLGARYITTRRRPMPRRSDLTGFYVGAHLGGAFSASNTFNGLVLSDYDARLLGGVQTGVDWQFAGNWVVGAEGHTASPAGTSPVRSSLGGYVYDSASAGSPPSPPASATPSVQHWSTSKAATPIPTTASR
jgi:outer membrane immunogenic protein